MQLGFGAAADMRRIDADRPRVAQRLRIDDFERVLKRTGQRQVDAQPFGALAELAQLDCPAGDLHPLEHAARRGEIEMLAGETRRAADLANKWQSVEIVDRQIVVAKAALGVHDIAGMGYRIEVEAELDRSLVENAVMDVVEYPAATVGYERGGPQLAQP